MNTTKILIDGDIGYLVASCLTDFTSRLAWFGMYCQTKSGTTKDDFVKVFKVVKTSFDSLLEDRQISDSTLQPVNDLFKRIEKTLKSRKLTDGKMLEISHDVFDFLNNHIWNEGSQNFKHRFLEEAISRKAREYYSDELFRAISDHLETGHYDEAVLTAFKYLDAKLRELAGITSYQFYGEDLINKVFSPTSGNLQLNPHPNEQVGLRNWFSGANAVFRNPSAHRFVRLNEDLALAVISMIALMSKMATNLSKNSKKIKDA